MDCQWVATCFGSRRPIALLQLASHKGNIALIQIQELNHIPSVLESLLSDCNVVKVGIESDKDARFLGEDYNISVKSTFDLRFLAEDVGIFPGSLKRLAKEVLNIELQREEDLLFSDWEQTELDSDQIEYAESSVRCSIDIFKNIIKRKLSNPSKGNTLNYCRQNLNKRFIFRSENYQ